jgi:hypothetical protein
MGSAELSPPARRARRAHRPAPCPCREEEIFDQRPHFLGVPWLSRESRGASGSCTAMENPPMTCRQRRLSLVIAIAPSESSLLTIFTI